MEKRPPPGPPPKTSWIPNSATAQQQEAQEKLREARELQSKAAREVIAMQADLQKAHDEMRATQQRADAAESDASARITALQAELRTAQRRADTAEREAKAQSDRANPLLAKLQQKVKEHSEIAERMKVRIRDFESQASNSSARVEEMSRLSTSLTTLEGELRLAQRRADEAGQEAERLRQQCDRAERAVAGQREIVHRMEQSAKDAESSASRRATSMRR